ncbi:MAG: ABC transporter permease [Porticoccaceae bacterium]
MDLSREASGFIASDLIIHSSIEVPRLYWDKAEELGLQTAESTGFSSMIFRGNHTHLGTVKAVGDLYPLRGELTITDVPFAPDDSTWVTTDQGPRAGEAWVEERLLPIMDMELGESIEVGNLELPVTRVIISEPDRGSGFSVMGARVMINANDLPATGVVQPGSRVSYHLLVAGEDSQVQSYQEWLDSVINEDFNEHLHYHLPEESEERLQNALERGRSFLLLAGTVGVLLAAIALALSSQRYAERHKDSIALMKSWGLSAARIRSILFRQIAILGVICTLIGLVLGVAIHYFLLWSIRDLLPGGLPASGAGPYLVASMTGIFCLMGFALPAMWHLPGIETLKGSATRFAHQRPESYRESHSRDCDAGGNSVLLQCQPADDVFVYWRGCRHSNCTGRYGLWLDGTV